MLDKTHDGLIHFWLLT